MEKTRILAVVIGLILIALAGAMYMGGVLTPSGVVIPTDTHIPDVIYTPIDGTEDFAFGTVEQCGIWKIVGTDIYDVNGYECYGTLYTSELKFWMIVDARGQIIAGGSPDSPIPISMT